MNIKWTFMSSAGTLISIILLSACGIVTDYHTPETVTAVQRALNAKGYDAGPADGKYGPQVANAVARFERKNQLPVDGKIDSLVLSELSGGASSHSGSLQSGPPSGVVPVGAISAPGCAGIEVVQYYESSVANLGRVFFIALRNNNSSARTVQISYRGGRTVLGNKNSGTLNAIVNAGAIKRVQLDYSENPPEIVRINKCL